MLLIKNSTFFDGISFAKGDILIKKDRIIRIGNFSPSVASQVISGVGKLTFPGLIDVNSNIDKRLSIFSLRAQRELINKGITTVICGNKGVSLAPLSSNFLKFFSQRVLNAKDLGVNFNWQNFDEFLKAIEKSKPLLNFGSLIGYSTLYYFLPGIDRHTLKQFFLEQEKKSLGVSFRVDRYFFEKIYNFLPKKSPKNKCYEKIVSLHFSSANLFQSSLEKIKEMNSQYKIEIADFPLSAKNKKIISFLNEQSSYDLHFDIGLNYRHQNEVYKEIDEILIILPFLKLKNSILSPMINFFQLEKFLPLQKLIYKMTVLPAKKFGLKERGEIKENYYADLVIFNEKKISDVIINGKLVVKDGEFQNERGGRVLEYEYN